MLGLLVLCVLLHSLAECSDYEFNEEQTPAFGPEERYLDIFPLTKDNFTDSVLKNKDAWVVLFHSGSLARTWKTMAVNLRGVVWCGMIDIREEEELLKSIKYTPERDPEARVYPHGPMSIKKKSWKNVKNPNEARLIATESIPDQSLKVKGKNLQEFLLDSYMSTPSRFPLILLTDEVSTPVPFKALSNRFGNYFNFGLIMHPTLDDYKALGMQDYFLETPLLLVLIAEIVEDPHRNPDATTGNMGFSAVQFDTKRLGAMNYPNVMKFLFAINYNFRYKLPGENQSNEKHIAEMEDVLEIEQKRFDINAYSKNATRKATRQDSNDVKFKSTATTASGSSPVRDEL